MAARESPFTPDASETGWTKTAICRTICISALAIPLTISPGGRDVFRLPKELAFRAEVVILVALILIGLTLRHFHWRSLPFRHPALVIPSMILMWTFVTTLTSTNVALSLRTLAWSAGACVVFVATWSVARSRSIAMLDWLIWGGIVNATLYIGVALRLFPNPIPLAAGNEGYDAATGLLGNANDVGSALLPVVIAAFAAAVASPARRRYYAPSAALLGATVLASASLAAIGALLVAIASLALSWSWKRTLAALGVILTAAAVLASVCAPLHTRVIRMTTAATERHWDGLLRGRFTSFAVAVEMFRDHPFTGVGPGVFGWQYFPYVLELSERAPGLFVDAVAGHYNFEEAHNDHFEVVAEMGFVGYLLFAGSIAFVAAGSLRRQRVASTLVSEEARRFARIAQLPIAAGLAVIALAQYPLQLTSSLTALIFLTAICAAWRDDVPLPRNEVENDA